MRRIKNHSHWHIEEVCRKEGIRLNDRQVDEVFVTLYNDDGYHNPKNADHLDIRHALCSLGYLGNKNENPED